jgi:L-ascorbate oxidase
MRPCDERTKPMQCQYNWTMEWYSVLSKACLDCPFNKKSCSLPHCVAANGVNRSIITINRMLPGPAVYVCQNDTVQVILTSLLHNSEGTSIHWYNNFFNMELK